VSSDFYFIFKFFGLGKKNIAPYKKLKKIVAYSLLLQGKKSPF
jgi:hypothetical protein